jgi:hypothetical protein
MLEKIVQRFISDAISSRHLGSKLRRFSWSTTHHSNKLTFIAFPKSWARLFLADITELCEGKGISSKAVRTERRARYLFNGETRDRRNTRQHLPLTPTMPHRTGLVEDMVTNAKLLIQSLRVSEVEGNENTRPMDQLKRRMKEGRLLAVSIILERISRIK